MKKRQTKKDFKIVDSFLRAGQYPPKKHFQRAIKAGYKSPCEKADEKARASLTSENSQRFSSAL